MGIKRILNTLSKTLGAREPNLKKTGVNTSLQWGLVPYPIIKHSSISAAKIESIYTNWGT